MSDKKPEFGVGSVVEFRSHDGNLHIVSVIVRDSNLFGYGEDGFFGVRSEKGGSQSFDGYWGYTSQITRVWNAGGLEEPASG